MCHVSYSLHQVLLLVVTNGWRVDEFDILGAVSTVRMGPLTNRGTSDSILCLDSPLLFFLSECAAYWSKVDGHAFRGKSQR